MNNPLPDTGETAVASRPAASLATSYRALARAFRGGGIATPELDARLLVCAACGLSHEAFIADPDRPLKAGEEAALARLRERRLAGEPVSRILGEREFWGLRFSLSPDTLDPRPDTETLVAALLELASEKARGGEGLSILDLGTGSGCILVSALHELPEARGVGVDISPAALATARANAERHGIDARACFICGDWLGSVSGRFSFIVSNPPYIPAGEIGGLAREVAECDPRRALDGGADGLDCYRRIVGELDRVLAPGGWALFEVGAGQHEAVTALVRTEAFGGRGAEVRLFRDLAGRVRCVAFCAL